MLQIIIPEREFFDNSKQMFLTCKEQKLILEHSLLSISKWESKWKKPFLKNEQRTYEESVDYFRCMTINKDVDPNIYYGLTKDHIKQINEYIDDKMTATWFNEKDQKGKRGPIITSELIYYWMIAYNIPFECEKWHLNRLLTLIKVCDIKNAPKKKMKKSEIYSRNRSLNAARKQHLGTSG